MRGLIIRRPHIDKILDGHKTWEMRSIPCKHREQIALIQSGTKSVIGVADLVDCIGPLNNEERRANEDKHCVPLIKWSDPVYAKYRFGWILANVQRLPTPVYYNHPSGAVVWVMLENSPRCQTSYHLKIEL